MDENPEWLTQNTEDPKSYKGNLTPRLPPHTVNVIELANPISTSTPPPFQVYPPFLAKSFVCPPSESIFGRS